MIFSKANKESNNPKKFDLNVENILENWDTSFAIREIISNALDETNITKCQEIKIFKDNSKKWHIRDYGRGLSYHHLTQNENEEKKRHLGIIGKFGVGLKDSFAVLSRHNIDVNVYSKHNIIELGIESKNDFNDIKTLNALIYDPSDEEFVGTEFVINVKDEDIEKSKKMFLYFNRPQLLDKTEYGEIYKKNFDNEPASIYINGVKVSEEENFLFSYNITKIDSKLNKSLNRERNNVGRSAYTDIIKKILLNAKSDTVIQEIISDFNKFTHGTQSDEKKWKDVQIYAIKICNQNNDIIFVSASDSLNNNQMEIIDSLNCKIIKIPDNIYKSIENERDFNGNEIKTFSSAVKEYNSSFEFKIINENELTENERKNWSKRNICFEYYGNKKYLNKIFISENINPNINGDILGVYDPDDDCIYIKRSILNDLSQFLETLFHELAHATSKYDDNTRMFENELGKIIYSLCKKHIENN